jgi:hypothetical protein
MQAKKEPVSRSGLDQRPQGMICKGCGGRVKEVPQIDSSKLRRGFDEEYYVPVRSFQCDRCEVILCSDELTMGKFVPPQFRLEMTSTRIEEQERSPALSSENEIVVTVEAAGVFRSRRA